MGAKRKYLSIKEVAAELGVNVETVRRWVREDRVPYYKAHGTTRLCLDDLKRRPREGGDSPQSATRRNT